MRIRKALKEAKKEKGTLDNWELGFYIQDAETLFYWLVEDPFTNQKQKVERLKKVLASPKWTLTPKSP